MRPLCDDKLLADLIKKQYELDLAKQTSSNRAKEIETLKVQLAQKDEESGSLFLKNMQMTKHRDEAVKNLAALEEEMKMQEEKLAKKCTDVDESCKLLEENRERIRALETETEKLKAENVKLQEMNNFAKERANTALKTAERRKLEFEVISIVTKLPT